MNGRYEQATADARFQLVRALRTALGDTAAVRETRAGVKLDAKGGRSLEVEVEYTDDGDVPESQQVAYSVMRANGGLLMDTPSFETRSRSEAVAYVLRVLETA